MINLTGVKPQGEFTVLPAGNYLVQAEEAVLTDTKSFTGKYIKVKFKVVPADKNRTDLNHEGAGRYVFHNFNVQNQNAMAVQIGLSQLKGFMVSAGVLADNLEDVRDLEGLSCVVNLKVQQDPTYGDKNVISYFKAYDEAKHAKAAAPVKDQMGFDSSEEIPF